MMHRFCDIVLNNQADGLPEIAPRLSILLWLALFSVTACNACIACCFTSTLNEEQFLASQFLYGNSWCYIFLVHDYINICVCSTSFFLLHHNLHATHDVDATLLHRLNLATVDVIDFAVFKRSVYVRDSCCFVCRNDNYLCA